MIPTLWNVTTQAGRSVRVMSVSGSTGHSVSESRTKEAWIVSASSPA